MSASRISSGQGRDGDRVWAKAQLRPSLLPGTIQGPFSEQEARRKACFPSGMGKLLSS